MITYALILAITTSYEEVIVLDTNLTHAECVTSSTTVEITSEVTSYEIWCVPEDRN